MPKRLTINIGFITNSSSCVYYFPKEVLDDPDVKTFIEAHELELGYVGRDLWSRSDCHTFAVTKEQKEDVKRELGSSEYCPQMGGYIDPESDGVYILYGDEYHNVTHILCAILAKAYAKISGNDPNGYPRSGYLTDYN